MNRPDWNRLERERQRAAQELYDLQVVDGDELTRCDQCGKQCESMAELVVHVAKFHSVRRL